MVQARSAGVTAMHGAAWLYLVHPIAVKIYYIKVGARLHAVGHPWHPSRPGKIVPVEPVPRCNGARRRSGGSDPITVGYAVQDELRRSAWYLKTFESL